MLGLNKSLEMIHAEGVAAGLRAPSPDGRSDARGRAGFGPGACSRPTIPRPASPEFSRPPGLDGSKLVRYMRDELGVSVQGGQDQMKGKLVRIGHMGYLGPFDMLIAVSALEMALERLGHRFDVARAWPRSRDRIARRPEQTPMAETLRVLLSDSLDPQGVEVLSRYPRIQGRRQDWSQAGRTGGNNRALPRRWSFAARRT